MLGRAWSSAARWSPPLLALALGGCAGLEPITRATTPVASPADPQKYLQIELRNGLRALLISDPGAERAAAALAVSAGSRDDPEGYEGLAHFLEHMLFLGTDRYPGADDYQKFIVSRGGRYNGYTAFDHSNYFFEVEAAALAPALSRFARFFVAPLMSARFVQRERQAVEAEYRAGLKDDARGRLEVFKERLNPAHPYAKFAVGGAHTLPEAGLGAALRDFYRRHYRAGRMRLVIYSPYSPRRMERLLRRHFSPLAPAAPVSRRPIAAPLFLPQALPQRVHLTPQKELRQLNMLFPVDDQRLRYRSKPLRYLAHLLGHEGEGSLLSLLKARGWAERLVAGAGLDYDGGAAFEVEIGLTPAGFKAVEQVAAATFAALAQIRAEGVAKWRFEELRRMAALDFRFAKRREPLAQVVSAAVNMLRYPPEEVLRGDYLLDVYDEPDIADLAARLRPDNALIMVTAPEFEGKGGRRSRHYDVPYALRAAPSPPPRRFAELRLPEPNPFIPSADWLDDIDIAPAAVDDRLAHPRRVANDGVVEHWHHRDRRYNTPRMDVLAALEFNAGADAAAAAATALWAALIGESLNEQIYPANLAGLNFSIAAAGGGLELRLDGYSQRQRRLLGVVAAALRRSNWPPDMFERLRAELIRNWRNREHEPSYRRLWARLEQLLRADAHPEAALIAAMRDLNAETLADFTTAARRAWRLRMLTHGAASAAAAESLTAPLRALVASSPAPPPPRVRRLREGERFSWRESFPHPDAAAILYLQGERRSLAEQARFALSAQLLKADFFHQLRTKRQLGYIVYMTGFSPLDAPGVAAVAQSPKAEPADLAKQMREFWNTAASVSKKDFKRGREALVRRLHKRDTARAAVNGRWWAALRRGDADFSRRRRLAQAVGEVSRDEWLRFVERALGGATRRQLLLSTTDAADGAAVVADMAAFAEGRAAFVGWPPDEAL